MPETLEAPTQRRGPRRHKRAADAPSELPPVMAKRVENCRNLIARLKLLQETLEASEEREYAAEYERFVTLCIDAVNDPLTDRASRVDPRVVRGILQRAGKTLADLEADVHHQSTGAIPISWLGKY